MGAIAKGARRTRSRFGARIEPLSHAELRLPSGSRRLGDPHRCRADPLARTSPRELRLHGDSSGCGRVRPADVPGGRCKPSGLRGARSLPRCARGGRISSRRASDRSARALIRSQAPLGRRLPAAPRRMRLVRGARAARGLLGIRRRRGVQLLPKRRATSLRRGARRDAQPAASPLAEARAVGLTSSTAREILWVVEQIHSYHGGFRLRTLAQR